MSSQPQAGRGQRSDGPAYPAMTDWRPDDELSLADLVWALVRQWKIIAGVTVICVALAVAYALLRPDQYRYTVELKIGQIPNEQAQGGYRPIETPETVVAQLENSIIPEAVRETIRQDAELTQDDGLPEINAESPEGSLIVRLAGEAPVGEASPLTGALGRAAVQIVLEHVDALSSALEGSERHQSRLQSRLGPLEERLATLAERRDTLRNMVGRSDAAALAAGTELSTVLTRRGQLIQERADIKESLQQVGERIEVLRKAVDTLRAAEATPEQVRAHRQVSADVRAVANLQPTRMLSAPTRSLEPVGIGGAIIVALALVLGLGGGVVLALLVDAVRRDA